MALKKVSKKKDTSEELIGRSVTFNDGENDFEGEIVSINTDGTFRVDTGEQEWDLEKDEFDLEDDTENVEEPEEEAAATEEADATDITYESLNKMNIKQLKQVIKEEGIKGVPLSSYRSEEKLIESICESLKIDIPEKKEKEKGEKEKQVAAPKKEKKEAAPKKEKRSFEDLTTVKCARVFTKLLKKGASRKELLSAAKEVANPSTASTVLSDFFRYLTVLGILEEKDGKFSITF